MLSFTKTLATFPFQVPCPSLPRAVTSLAVIRSSTDSDNNTSGSNDVNASPPIQPPISPPETVEIRFRRGSRRRKRQQEDGVASSIQSKQAPAPKDWDSMTLTEKALELYVGEKGLLFWLNKFAYASIFIIIGGWILFRFVGPALNLYQLDTPPLSPTSILKG